jgi:iron(III) transport system ATP-binding protein
VLLTVRPEDITLEPATEGDWIGTVQTRAYLGEGVDHMVLLGDRTVRAKTNHRISIPDGTSVRLVLTDDACAIVPDGNGAADVAGDKVAPSLESADTHA